MDYEFRFPDLGEGIAEAELRAWYVKAGDEIAEHQAIAEVETDKAVAEIPSPKKGRVVAILKAVGETLRVGDPFIILALAGSGAEAGAAPAAAEAAASEHASLVGVLPEEEEAGAAAPRRPAATQPAAPQPTAMRRPASPRPHDEGGAILAVPGVRAIADKTGIDLAGMAGSGPEGSVTMEDLLSLLGKPRGKAASLSPRPAGTTGAAGAARAGAGATAGEASTGGASEDAFGPIEVRPLRGLRKTIARHLAAANERAVSVTVHDEFDATDLWAVKEAEGRELEKRGVKLTILPFVAKAVQLALAKHPSFNAAFDDEAEAIVLKSYVNLGFAVDTEEGLIVPVLRSVKSKSIADIAAELGSLAQKARARKLEAEELKGSSFTITNYGPYGGRFGTPILNYPDVAILGCGRMGDRPWVVGGELAVRKVLPLSLSFDHRANDGAEAGRLLTDIGRYLQNPGLFLVEGI